MVDKNKPKSKKLPDEKRSLEEIILDFDYPIISYEVTTEDGYILKLYRINGRKCNKPSYGN